MNPSFASRVALMEAAYRASFTANDEMRRRLAAGIFWLADNLEEEVRAKNIPTLTHALASIGDIRDMAENIFKDKSLLAGTEQFSSECSRLLADSTDYS
jgi:hypothetical protein